MTRRARSGNTQKHQKMPGDATSWEEFSTASKINRASKGGNANQILKGRIEKKKHNIKKKFELGDSKKYIKQFDSQSSKNKFSKTKTFSNSLNNEGLENVAECSSDDQTTSNDNIQDVPQKISSIVATEGNNSTLSGVENSSTKVITKRQLKKARSKMKLIALDVLRSGRYECEVSDNQDRVVVESPNSLPTVFLENKKIKNSKKNKRNQERMSENAVDTLEENDVESMDQEDEIQKKSTETSVEALKKKIKNSKKNKRNQERMSENAVDTSEENDVESMDQEDEIQKKSTETSVEALNNILSKNEASKPDDTTEVKRLTKNQWRKARIKRKFALLKAKQASEDKEIKSDNETNKKSPILTTETDPADKKELSLDKLERKKQQNEKTILPSSVESKISDLKKTLKKKGLSDKKIRDIIRKERRHEKRTFSTKPCFNCRKIGHFLSDCPLPLGDSTQVTGVCFKCGSTEHTSYKCQKKVEGYPLAKCFVCKEQGHISKDCPKNERGVYIHGGKCTLCGNVNHLSKDCPSNKKEKDDSVTVDIINEGMSVDAEVVETVSIPKNTSHKKKIVKF